MKNDLFTFSIQAAETLGIECAIVLAATKDLKNPTKGYMVGENEVVDIDTIAKDADIDITDKGEYDEEGAQAKDHLARAADAALELQGILDDDENLPEWVQNKITKALDYLDISRDYMKQELGEYAPHPGSEESWDGVNQSTAQTLATNNQGYEGPVAPEGEKDPTQLTKITKEDHVGDKKSIMDYLSDVEKQRTEDMLKDPIKTFKTNDGKELKIYGNEDDGYRVKANNKELKKSFGKLADAELACETFVQRSNDYANEK